MIYPRSFTITSASNKYSSCKINDNYNFSYIENEKDHISEIDSSSLNDNF